MKKPATLLFILTLLPLLNACKSEKGPEAGITRTGFIQTGALDEASGMQAGIRNSGVYYLHNDDGKAVLYAMDEEGRDLGKFVLAGTGNRDWEDITAVPSDSGPLLVIGDIGDNVAQWNHVILHFAREPAPGPGGRFSGSVEVFHSVRLRYPEGARDCESLAYDPASGDLLFISKRDRPPRIYRIALDHALAVTEAQLEFVGETFAFRAPTSKDMLYFGQRDGPWVAQPTGFDINRDGSAAAVISYRSIYLFNRRKGESWPAALAREPTEFEGPPSRKEEAISYAPGGGHIMITTEGLPAPVYRFRVLPRTD